MIWANRLIIYDFSYYTFVFLAFILGRYFLLAGGTFWGIALFSKRSWRDVCHRDSKHLGQLIRNDIALSITSAVLFACVAAAIMLAYRAGHTRLYHDIHDYGWWYLAVSFGAVLILQDAYFYFTHRLLHHPVLFQRLHRGHHRSRVPTPWTSFAFEPGEALIHSFFFVILVFVLPLHFITLIAAFLTMTIWAISTHLSVPIPAANMPFAPLRRGLIGPTHHGIHHRKYHVHFGLYFTFWDHVFGTTDPDYWSKILLVRKS